MRKVRFIVTVPATFWIAVLMAAISAQGKTVQEKAASVFFFDVLELPARLDEPKLLKLENRYSLKCAIANRSDEPLLGLRVILMIVDHDGKLRTRLTWSEESPVASSSIGAFEFIVPIKQKILTTDSLFLSVDEVIGRETIWRAVDAEKALRAYTRGQHDVVPTVKTVANKYDREPIRAIPKLERKK
jgi:hypothetical protein